MLHRFKTPLNASFSPITGRVLAVLMLSGLMMASPVAAATFNTNFDEKVETPGVGYEWSNTGNWTHGFPTSEANAGVTGSSTAELNSSEEVRQVSVGAATPGTLNVGATGQLSGYFHFFVGNQVTGTINMNGGSLDNTVAANGKHNYNFYIGQGNKAGGNGIVNLNSGSITTGIVYLGRQKHVNPEGTLNVGSGTLTCDGLLVGTSGSVGTLSVTGSDASIQVNGDITLDQATLAFALDESGTSTIKATGAVELAGVLELSVPSHVKSLPSNVTLLQTKGSVLGTFSSVNMSGLSGDLVYGSNTVYLENVSLAPSAN